MGNIKLQDKRQGTYLNQQIQSGDFTSFMLFVGQTGIGKMDSALEFAASVLCDNVSGEPCQMCSNCKLVVSGNHPDLLQVGGEGTIKIASIRELQKSLYLKPYQAKHKVAIIRDSHLMTEESANAMLKVLEEPPENCIIILTSPDKKLLPGTVVSRSQIVNFGTVILQKTEDNEEIFVDAVNILKKSQFYEKMAMAQKYSKEKPLTVDFLNALEGILREAILGENDLNSDYSERKIISVLELVEKSREYLKNNLSGKFVLENLIINLG